MVDLDRDLGASCRSDLAAVVISKKNLSAYLLPWSGVLGFPSHGYRFGYSNSRHPYHLPKGTTPR